MREPRRERAVLVGVEFTRRERSHIAGWAFRPEESLEELRRLAQSAGAEVVGEYLQARPAPDPATLIGAGKVQELALAVTSESAGVVIFDHELSPTQQRNLERELDCKVIDRTQLILDVFAGRARTREGKLQVELAQLTYLLPRLAGRGAEMSRLGGGIGTRGPGETQLETDRRKIFRRIRKIEQQLEAVRRTRGVQRAQRRSVPFAAVVLVGYTNAGKSTLFNRLTGAEVVADARMFATLDPTARLIVLPSRRRAVLSDTVGFLRNLPTTLVQAFRATLEEVAEAALLLHVVDVSAPDAAQQAGHVRRVLAEIGASQVPELLVLNKIDLLEPGIDSATLARRVEAESTPPTDGDRGGGRPAAAATVSAKTGEGIDDLLAAIDRALSVDQISLTQFRFPPGAGREVRLLHEYAVVRRKEYDGEGCLIEAEVPESLRRRLSNYVALTNSGGRQ